MSRRFPCAGAESQAHRGVRARRGDAPKEAGGHFSWDPSTQTETVTDPRGNLWKDVYANNLLVKRVDALGNTTQFAYDASLNKTSVDPHRNEE